MYEMSKMRIAHNVIIYRYTYINEHNKRNILCFVLLLMYILNKNKLKTHIFIFLSKRTTSKHTSNNLVYKHTNNNTV